MSSRGRPPKNGTPFDRLLKKQCQKGKNFTHILSLVFLCQKTLVRIFLVNSLKSKINNNFSRQIDSGQLSQVKIELKLEFLQEFQPQNLPESLGNGVRPHSPPSAQPPYHPSKFRGRKSSLSRKIHQNRITAIR